MRQNDFFFPLIQTDFKSSLFSQITQMYSQVHAQALQTLGRNER